jgi:hypothetical protein
MKRETSRERVERQRERGSVLAQAPLSISWLIEQPGSMVYMKPREESDKVPISARHPRMR